MSVNGVLAGLVAITAPCAFVTVKASLLIGLAAGVLVVCAVKLLDSLKIDDPVGAIPVHLFNGTFGTLCVGLFAVDRITGAATGNGLFYGGGATLLMAQLKALWWSAPTPYGSVARLLACHQTRSAPRQRAGRGRRSGSRRARPGSLRRVCHAGHARERTGNRLSRYLVAGGGSRRPTHRRAFDDAIQLVQTGSCALAGAALLMIATGSATAQTRSEFGRDHAHDGSGLPVEYFFRGIRQETDPKLDVCVRRYRRLRSSRVTAP
jgi:hypothetical protein